MNTPDEIIRMPSAKTQLQINTIDLQEASDGWRWGYHISVSAIDKGSSYTCGKAMPLSKTSCPSRFEAIRAASDAMKAELPDLGTDMKVHQRERQMIKDWLDNVAPAQMELF